jgi:putative ABC transport system permease protein
MWWCFSAEPGSGSALHDLEQLPGVQRAEPVRAVQARIRHGHHSRKLAITGMPRDADLNRLLDAKAAASCCRRKGSSCPRKLGEILGARIGDVMQVEALEGQRATTRSRHPRFHGGLRRCGRLHGHQRAASPHARGRHGQRRLSGRGSGALGRVHARGEGHAAHRHHAGEEDQLEAFRSTTGQSIGIMRKLYLTLAIIVAFGVVYNSARIALSERSRDLATLRVVGFTQREVAGVLLGELILLIVGRVAVGLLFGQRACHLHHRTPVRTETCAAAGDQPVHLHRCPCSWSAAAACASFIVVSRMLRKLDMVGVLKARD